MPRGGVRRMRERHAQRYLLWVRPALLLVVLALLVSTAITDGASNAPIDYIVFAASTGISIVSIIALRRHNPLKVASNTAISDLLLTFVWVVDSPFPAQSAVVLVWPIVVLAYLGTSQIAISGTVVAAAGLWVASFQLDTWHDREPVPASVIGLLGAGSMIGFVTRQRRRVERALAASLARDRVALSLARRIRMADDPGDAIQEIARTVGEATGASRSLVLLLEHDDDFVADLATWSADGSDLVQSQRIDMTTIDSTLRHLVSAGHGVLLDHSGVRLLTLSEGDEILAPGSNSVEVSLRALLTHLGNEYGIMSPLPMGGRAVGAIVLAGTAQVDWSTEVLPLLEPLAPQLAAGLAQVVLVRDQRDALTSLERVDSMRNRLIANVSHELRTPLTSTIGFVETLLREDIDMSDRQRRELMEHARDGGLRLLALVEDLLALGSTRPDSLDLDPTPIEAGRLLVDSLRGIEVPEGRMLRIGEVDRDAAVVVDRNRMLQVLSNLVVNAIRHGRGDVELRSSRSGTNVLIDVIDGGDGVAPEHVPELFLPFARFSSRTDSTGLGLAICRTIVEAHGGTIDYDRIDHGRTRFRVCLPGDRPAVS